MIISKSIYINIMLLKTMTMYESPYKVAHQNDKIISNKAKSNELVEECKPYFLSS